MDFPKIDEPIKYRLPIANVDPVQKYERRSEWKGFRQEAGNRYTFIAFIETTEKWEAIFLTNKFYGYLAIFWKIDKSN